MSAPYPLVRNFSAVSTRSGVLTRPSREGSSPSWTSSCWMRCCIAVLYMGISSVPGVAAGSGIDITALDAASTAQVPALDPDALYRNRETLTSALGAADIWAARLAANPADFESAWKLARARYWLGTNGLPEGERRA